MYARGEEVGETTKKQKNTDENRIGKTEKERRMIGSIRVYVLKHKVFGFSQLVGERLQPLARVRFIHVPVVDAQRGGYGQLSRELVLAKERTRRGFVDIAVVVI